MWLLCHICNADKSSVAAGEWFDGVPVFSKFGVFVKSKGLAITAGVLVDRLGPIRPPVSSRPVTIADRTVTPLAGRIQPLGLFALRWSLSLERGMYKALFQLRQFKNKVFRLFTARSGRGSALRDSRRSLTIADAALDGAERRRRQIGSASGGQSSSHHVSGPAPEPAPAVVHGSVSASVPGPGPAPLGSRSEDGTSSNDELGSSSGDDGSVHSDDSATRRLLRARGLSAGAVIISKAEVVEPMYSAIEKALGNQVKRDLEAIISDVDVPVELLQSLKSSVDLLLQTPGDQASLIAALKQDFIGIRDAGLQLQQEQADRKRQLQASFAKARLGRRHSACAVPRIVSGGNDPDVVQAAAAAGGDYVVPASGDSDSDPSTQSKKARAGHSRSSESEGEEQRDSVVKGQQPPGGSDAQPGAVVNSFGQ